MITTGEGRSGGQTWEQYYNSVYARKKQRNLPVGPSPAEIKKKSLASGIVLFAEVNHGRWIVKCPWCNSAEFAFETGPFVCDNCHNVASGGQAVEVKFPKEKDKIVMLLDKRPLVANQNWLPGETPDMLRSENKFYGLELD